jgi:hypothetical protein
MTILEEGENFLILSTSNQSADIKRADDSPGVLGLSIDTKAEIKLGLF